MTRPSLTAHVGLLLRTESYTAPRQNVKKERHVELKRNPTLSCGVFVTTVVPKSFNAVQTMGKVRLLRSDDVFSVLRPLFRNPLAPAPNLPQQSGKDKNPLPSLGGSQSGVLYKRDRAPQFPQLFNIRLNKTKLLIDSVTISGNLRYLIIE